jgi:hypothetical protein
MERINWVRGPLLDEIHTDAEAGINLYISRVLGTMGESSTGSLGSGLPKFAMNSGVWGRFRIVRLARLHMRASGRLQIFGIDLP